MAPGAQLASAVFTASSLYLSNQSLAVEQVTLKNSLASYLRLSGTSISAGVTSGVVAWMIQAHRKKCSKGTGQYGQQAAPPLAPNTIKAILQQTAVAVPGADALSQGAGALNGEGAVRLFRLAIGASDLPGPPVRA